MNSHDPAEVSKFDQLAHRFWDSRGEFKPLHVLNPVRLDYVRARAVLPGAKALDVGCGGGLLAEGLAAAGAEVTAIDLAPGMIEVAELHALESGASVRYLCASAEVLAAEIPGVFDVVCCMEMLEHVPEPAETLATLAKLAKPGGAVFISTLNRNPRSFFTAIVGAEYLLRLLPRGTHEYERLIKPAELAAWGRDCGLTLLDLAGLEYNALTELATLTNKPQVNYLAHFVREP
jgi:2-polyprenyl-6-hydroxyphenyl methylase/3-demethylubiquinone-9 3-methyltransferase